MCNTVDHKHHVAQAQRVLRVDLIFISPLFTFFSVWEFLALQDFFTQQPSEANLSGG